MTGNPEIWATRTLGEAASELREAVRTAIPRAHASAVAAQSASETRRRDPYGHTMKNRQHECLVEAGGLIDGVQLVRLRGASYQLLQVSDTGTVLFPWRYASSSRIGRERARMRPSAVRRGLLQGQPSTTQLTLDHAGLTDSELELRLAAEDEAESVANALSQLSRVVTIGYASSPSGLFDLGWGIAELHSGLGVLEWRTWETIAPLKPGHSAGESQAPTGSSAHLRAVAAGRGGTPVAGRFDQSADLEEIEIVRREVPQENPTAEPGRHMGGTGTELDRP